MTSPVPHKLVPTTAEAALSSFQRRVAAGDDRNIALMSVLTGYTYKTGEATTAEVVRTLLNEVDRLDREHGDPAVGMAAGLALDRRGVPEAPADIAVLVQDCLDYYDHLVVEGEVHRNLALRLLLDVDTLNRDDQTTTAITRALLAEVHRAISFTYADDEYADAEVEAAEGALGGVLEPVVDSTSRLGGTS
jgi:hypothetical protein